MAYMVVSNTFVKEIYVLQEDDEFAVVCLADDYWGSRPSGFRVRQSRIFGTKTEAEAHAGNRSSAASKAKPRAVIHKPGAPDPVPVLRQKTHHDYELEYYEELIRHGSRKRRCGNAV